MLDTYHYSLHPEKAAANVSESDAQSASKARTIRLKGTAKITPIDYQPFTKTRRIMKRINKSMEKKQRVLVRETDELGTVTDRVLMKRSGTPMLYYQVKLDAHPDIDRWYWADQLRNIRERCRVTFENGDGQTVIFELEQDYEAQSLSMEVSGRPKNLKEHVGLHATLINDFMDGIRRHGHR